MRITNWKGDISYQAASIQYVNDVDEIVRIVRESDRYPSPVRARGSHHSTTHCLEASAGTVIDMTGLNKILKIDAQQMTITMQAGVLLIDAALALEHVGLQFYVNIELGNATVGSVACCATKDASYYSQHEGRFEYGQVASYVVGLKYVGADGEMRQVDNDDDQMLAALRSSYGLLGLVYEVTVQVKPLTPLAFHHESYSLNQFTNQLDDLLASKRSVMLYLFPYIDRVVVEFRYDGKGTPSHYSWQWWLRNWVWKTGSPGLAKILKRIIPSAAVRHTIVNGYERLTCWVLVRVLRGNSSNPVRQVIRYPPRAGFSAYTFSIWAIPRRRYAKALKDYFLFCQQYFERHGFRCDLPNVGYSITQDQQSLLSYTRAEAALTIDPVATGGEGWQQFLEAYNDFCSARGGMPLFNQTPFLTDEQAIAALGPEIEVLRGLCSRYDPRHRFLNAYFRELFRF